MTTEQAPPEADETTSDDATEGRPAQTVRVPNVSPNAKSGLDHTIIGSNALEGAGDEAVDLEPDGEPADGEGPPQGDLDAALAWLNEAEDSDTARDRADAVWGAYSDQSADDPSADPANADLAVALRKAVYGDPGPATQPDGGQAAVANDTPAAGEVVTAAGDADPGDTLLGTVTVPEGLTGEDLDAWISGDAVEGDEQNNPERHAAYLARIEAAAAAGHTRPGEAGDGSEAAGS